MYTIISHEQNSETRGGAANAKIFYHMKKVEDPIEELKGEGYRFIMVDAIFDSNGVDVTRDYEEYLNF